MKRGFDLFGDLTCTGVYKSPTTGDEHVHFEDGVPIRRSTPIGPMESPGVGFSITVANPVCHGMFQVGRQYRFTLTDEVPGQLDSLPETSETEESETKHDAA